MFAKRNSITLAALWLILLIIGIFWYINDTRNLVEMMKEQVVLSSTLKDSQKEIKRLVSIEKTYSELNEHWLDADKKIIGRRWLCIIDPHEYSFRTPIRFN